MSPPRLKKSEVALLEHLFLNGGEIGALIRAYDWSTTPLGPMAGWPQSLRVSLQILLASKFPMQILWGEEYIQFYNDAYIAIAGDKHPTALGQRGEDCWQEVWDFVHPQLDQVMMTGIATWSEDQLMVLNRNGYPEECFFTFSYTPIWEETSGTVAGIFIAVQETTKRILSERRERELRLEMEVAKKEAEYANQLKDQFLAVLSHELRAPLNPIVGWASLLRTRTFPSTTVERALETIERNAKLQAQMVDDLLDVSRILRGKLHLNLRPVQLDAVINAALETVQSAASEKSLTIQIDLDDGAPLEVLGDAHRLQQVIWNLLSNAVKFTPAEGQISIGLQYLPGSAVIRVMDSGRGIVAEFLPYVFDRFRQADSMTTKEFGGLGLGLAIAHQIVELHGGTITAASDGAEQGATFTVELPLTEQLSPITEPTAEVVDADALLGLRMLMVEDEADSRELLTEILQLYGADVTAVGTAAEVLSRLANQQFDVLISDIGMPDVDGFALLKQVRQQPQGRQIPAIALTAYVSDLDQEQAMRVGFQAHVAKPLEPIHLINTILKVVKG